MNQIRKFVYQNQLQPADAVIVKKKGWNIQDHHVVYLGYDNGDHWFIVNLEREGVIILNDSQLMDYSYRFMPERIIRFQGNEFERNQAVQRGLSQVGKPYNLLYYNCEHLSAYIQSGRATSNQVNAGVGITIIALLFGLIIRNG